jgi:hypothetical protein
MDAYVMNVELRMWTRILQVGRETPPVPYHLVIARSGSMYRCEMSCPVAQVTWVTNGVKTWDYRADLHEYIEGDAEPWPAELGPGLPGIDWKYVSKFRAIADMDTRAKLVKDEGAPDQACPGPTALIELSLGDAQEPRTEQLRIDTSAGLVCQSVLVEFRSRKVTPFTRRTETRWVYQQLSGPIDPALFAFNPPKKARRVKHFSEPPSAEPMSDWNR